ncbi:hypothetical protein [Lentzea sp. NPDC051838]|uniref:hypothetical protein n=1 Tax=Lentzea sp. NPDC051838 TaxID=3154849 RepID=UPI0034225A41
MSSPTAVGAEFAAVPPNRRAASRLVIPVVACNGEPTLLTQVARETPPRPGRPGA